MKQTYTDPGGCVGCEVCYLAPDICPQCAAVETVCDFCGGLICGDGQKWDDRDICPDCLIRLGPGDEEDDDEQDV